MHTDKQIVYNEYIEDSFKDTVFKTKALHFSLLAKYKITNHDALEYAH